MHSTFFYSIAFLMQSLAILFNENNFVILGLISGVIGYFGNRLVQPIFVREMAEEISEKTIKEWEDRTVSGLHYL